MTDRVRCPASNVVSIPGVCPGVGPVSTGRGPRRAGGPSTPVAARGRWTPPRRSGEHPLVQGTPRTGRSASLTTTQTRRPDTAAPEGVRHRGGDPRRRPVLPHGASEGDAGVGGRHAARPRRRDRRGRPGAPRSWWCSVRRRTRSPPAVPAAAGTVVNAAWADGMGGSIARGLAAVRGGTFEPGRVLVLPCDLPHVTADDLRRLLDAADADGTDAAAAAFADTVGPPVIFTRGLYDRVARAGRHRRRGKTCCARWAIDSRGSRSPRPRGTWTRPPNTTRPVVRRRNGGFQPPRHSACANGTVRFGVAAGRRHHGGLPHDRRNCPIRHVCASRSASPRSPTVRTRRVESRLLGGRCNG